MLNLQHDALVDVRQTALILVKFMRLYRKMRVNFKGSLAPKEAVAC